MTLLDPIYEENEMYGAGDLEELLAGVEKESYRWRAKFEALQEKHKDLSDKHKHTVANLKSERLKKKEVETDISRLSDLLKRADYQVGRAQAEIKDLKNKNKKLVTRCEEAATSNNTFKEAIDSYRRTETNSKARIAHLEAKFTQALYKIDKLEGVDVVLSYEELLTALNDALCFAKKMSYESACGIYPESPCAILAEEDEWDLRIDRYKKLIRLVDSKLKSPKEEEESRPTRPLGRKPLGGVDLRDL